MPDGELEYGEQGEHIQELGSALESLGFLTSAPTEYNEEMAEALNRYAEGRGLSESSYVGIVSRLQADGQVQSAEWQRRCSQITSEAEATWQDNDAYEAPELQGEEQPQWEQNAAYQSRPDYDSTTSLNTPFVGEEQPGNARWRDSPDGRTETYYPDQVTADEAYGVQIADGRVTTSSGDPLDTTGVKTHATFSGSKSERMIYTMDQQGDVRAADPVAEMMTNPQVRADDDLPFGDAGKRFHHSSLASGEDVAAAGEMKVRDGVVEAVSDKSGHYTPGMELTAQMNARLEDGGVDTSRVTYEMGNYGRGAAAKGDTLVTGTELGSYTRAGILDDIWSKFVKEAEASAAAAWPDHWSGFRADQKQTLIEQKLAPMGESYEEFRAMDDAELFAEGRRILEGRHDVLRKLLKDIPDSMQWRPDPLGIYQWRWWDGKQYTTKVSHPDADGHDQVFDEVGGETHQPVTVPQASGESSESESSEQIKGTYVEVVPNAESGASTMTVRDEEPLKGTYVEVASTKSAATAVAGNEDEADEEEEGDTYNDLVVP